MDFKEFRKIRTKVAVPALECARGAGIDRSTVSLYESGTVDLTQKQIDALHGALVAAIRRRVTSFESALKRLLSGERKAGEGVGARSSGGDERPDAPGPTQ